MSEDTRMTMRGYLLDAQNALGDALGGFWYTDTKAMMEHIEMAVWALQMAQDVYLSEEVE
jgi:hypothetical protein